jgi:uncharacterized Tic20 family protein
MDQEPDPTPPPTVEPTSGPTPQPPLTNESKNLALLGHLLGLFTGFLGPLILWLVKKEDSFVEDQSREALNFQLTVLIAYIASGIAAIASCGILFPLPLAVWIADLVFCILAAVDSSKGNTYRYPVTIRFINA